MRKLGVSILALCVACTFLASCESKPIVPKLGTYVHTKSGYKMTITLSDINAFELSENDEPQVKGVYNVPSKGNGVFELTDVCFDGTMWFTYKEMKEVTNWDQTVPFTFDAKKITFLMPGIPPIELTYQD